VVADTQLMKSAGEVLSYRFQADQQRFFLLKYQYCRGLTPTDELYYHSEEIVNVIIK